MPVVLGQGGALLLELDGLSHGPQGLPPQGPGGGVGVLELFTHVADPEAVGPEAFSRVGNKNATRGRRKWRRELACGMDFMGAVGRLVEIRLFGGRRG